MGRRRLSRRNSARKTLLCRSPTLPKKRWPTSSWRTSNQLSALSSQQNQGGGRPCPLRMKNRWRGRLSRGSRRGLNLLIQHRLSVFSQQARRFGVYIGGRFEAGLPVLDQNGLAYMKGDGQ